jgi:hypothetical protein
MPRSELSTVEALQKKAASVSGGLKSFDFVASPEIKLQNTQSNRAGNDAGIFFLYPPRFSPLFYSQQVDGERCSGALQRPFWGDVSVQLPVPKAPLSSCSAKNRLADARRDRIRLG